MRDTVSYAYFHGGASLMDFLNAQSEFRQVQLAYAQLIGAYLTSAAQLNLAVGREVTPMTKTSLFAVSACLAAACLALAGCEKKFDPASGAALAGAGDSRPATRTGNRGPSGAISHRGGGPHR